MKKYIAEYAGTFALVFCGTGAIVINELSGAVTHVGISITFGLIVLAMIYSIGEVSGAHMNPAVSIAFAAAGRLPRRELLPYIFSQLSGAFTASAILKFMFPHSRGLGGTNPAGSDMQSFLLELILTFILMFVIMNVSSGAKEKGITAGIAVASVVGLEAMFAGPVSGASMNPARSLSPALLSGNVGHVWIYVIAPVAGALLSIPLWKIISVNKEKEEGNL